MTIWCDCYYCDTIGIVIIIIMVILLFPDDEDDAVTMCSAVEFTEALRIMQETNQNTLRLKLGP